MVGLVVAQACAYQVSAGCWSESPSATRPVRPVPQRHPSVPLSARQARWQPLVDVPCVPDAAIGPALRDGEHHRRIIVPYSARGKMPGARSPWPRASRPPRRCCAHTGRCWSSGIAIGPHDVQVRINRCGPQPSFRGGRASTRIAMRRGVRRRDVCQRSAAVPISAAIRRIRAWPTWAPTSTTFSSADSVCNAGRSGARPRPTVPTPRAARPGIYLRWHFDGPGAGVDARFERQRLTSHIVK